MVGNSCGHEVGNSYTCALGWGLFVRNFDAHPYPHNPAFANSSFNALKLLFSSRSLAM